MCEGFAMRCPRFHFNSSSLEAYLLFCLALSSKVAGDERKDESEEYQTDSHERFTGEESEGGNVLSFMQREKNPLVFSLFSSPHLKTFHSNIYM